MMAEKHVFEIQPIKNAGILTVFSYPSTRYIDCSVMEGF